VLEWMGRTHVNIHGGQFDALFLTLDILIVVHVFEFVARKGRSCHTIGLPVLLYKNRWCMICTTTTHQRAFSRQEGYVEHLFRVLFPISRLALE
jgi:hypothetical protein